jgi:hypothetical protein
MEGNTHHVPIDTRAYPRTLRLTFTYNGEQVNLAEIERVQMIAPAAVTPLPSTRHCGFWLEVRDAGARVLFHRVLHEPFQRTIEVHSPDNPIRIDRPGPQRGAFEVLIPDVPGAATLVLLGSPLQRERASEPARELACFPLPHATAGEEGSR